MLLDKKSAEDRKFALDKIKQIRAGPGPVLEKDKKVRSFHTPCVNLEAETLQQLIDWDKEQLTEPIFTIGLPMAELEEQALTGEALTFPDVPCHAQQGSIH